MLGHTQATRVNGSANRERLQAVGVKFTHYQFHSGVHELHRYCDHGCRPFRCTFRLRDSLIGQR